MKTKGTVPKECKLSNAEMETHISFDLVDRKWNMWTSIKKDMNKAKKQGWTLLKTERYTDGTIYSETYEAPENAITFRNVSKVAEKPERKPRSPMTEEQKEKMRQGRLAKKLEAELKAKESA